MKKNKIKNEILEKIRKDEVKMKPWWTFRVIWLGLNMTTWGMLAICAGFLAWFLWRVELLEPWEVLKFGELGEEIVLEEFPYGILLSILALGIGGYWFLKNTGENYKKSRVKMLLATALIVMAVTVVWWILKQNFELELLLRTI